MSVEDQTHAGGNEHTLHPVPSLKKTTIKVFLSRSLAFHLLLGLELKTLQIPNSVCSKFKPPPLTIHALPGA
jgi:hypothetical protein